MNPRSATFKVGLLVVILIGLGFFIYAGMHYTSRPSFCASCHEIEPSVVSYEQADSHQDVKCLGCHSEPGTIGYVKRKIYGLREVYVHLTEENPQPQADVPNEVCLQCHDDIVKAEETSNFNFSHQFHLSLKEKCTDCHAAVVHGDEVIYGKQDWPHQNSLGSTCNSCHADRQQSDCMSCHKSL